jgi:hypothetical protein
VSLKTCAKLMLFGTITALIYTHMQMQIFELAYKGKAKERRFHELMDDNGALTHQILALKSASHLGRELLEKDMGLQFVGRESVVTFSGPAAKTAVPVRVKSKQDNVLWNALSFLSPQEARAWDH